MMQIKHLFTDIMDHFWNQEQHFSMNQLQDLDILFQFMKMLLLLELMMQIKYLFTDIMDHFGIKNKFLNESSSNFGWTLSIYEDVIAIWNLYCKKHLFTDTMIYGNFYCYWSWGMQAKHLFKASLIPQVNIVNCSSLFHHLIVIGMKFNFLL
ncbi:hypothetical protein M0811_14222 [Anaeramoeba ignava]|uniref:Uncharacterized protein n=1 Tax=Anaeramoeba ignava TaxID=1746090 RepID=A0A9Q0LWV4_ANAIG|nr:hypothetical protein M0811_14222 [Anaeramoeba ignava]